MKKLFRRRFGRGLYWMVKVTCPICGVSREVIEVNTRRKRFTGICRSCWDRDCKTYWAFLGGYIIIWLPKDHPYYCMTHASNYILEHRLVMAEHLKRPLNNEEVVHHEDKNGRNNALDNLRLFASNVEHMRYHKNKGEVLCSEFS